MALVLLTGTHDVKAMGLSAWKRLLSKDHSSGNGSLNEPRGLLPEPMFLRALCFERKRAERSRKLFVLMLIDLEKPFQSGNGNDLLGRTVPAILSSIRETDIAGWYKESLFLGVIFAELGAADKEAIVSALRGKVTAALRSFLPTEELDRIRIVFHCFPEDWTDDPGIPIAKLYPDLVQRDEARKVSSAIKRAIDVLGSSMALILLSPIFLAVAVAIKLSSSGPILFRQQSIGQYGV